MPRKIIDRIVCVRGFQNENVIYSAFFTPEQCKKFLKVDYMKKMKKRVWPVKMLAMLVEAEKKMLSYFLIV